MSRNRKWSRGQSAVELAIAVPVLVLLLVVAADFARAFFFSIAVNNAARAGAQYGSQTVITAADLNGMKSAATTDGSNVPSLTATASQCTCESPSGSVTPCAGSYCTANATATFVEVDTSAPFTTIVKYPGVPHSLTLTGKAVMQVQE
ncbi:MAG: TadE/TadG family type IV pilus assembly protein [Candidatus Binatus sp.]